jgi:hypothetical protein
MTNDKIQSITKELRKAYPELDDFAANELVYITEHMDRLDISLEVIWDALCYAYGTRRIINGYSNAR